LHPNQKEALDQALMVLIKNSAAGEEKRGDLVGIFVLKFRSNKVEWLLAYRIVSKKEIALLVVGPHENFYGDLKNSI
jgi:hypothetical protein